MPMAFLLHMAALLFGVIAGVCGRRLIPQGRPLSMGHVNSVRMAASPIPASRVATTAPSAGQYESIVTGQRVASVLPGIPARSEFANLRPPTEVKSTRGRASLWRFATRALPAKEEFEALDGEEDDGEVLLAPETGVVSGRARALLATEEAEMSKTKDDNAAEELDTNSVSRRSVLYGTAGAASLAAGGERAKAEEDKSITANPWIQYDLNTGETLYDIDFDEQDPNHGFVVGARGLFYETKDGGNRWVSRSFANLGKAGGSENINYRFQNVAANGNDVWILGKPSLLLHSRDNGKTWKKVPLSRKLPGEPKLILATGPGKAEMATSSGAVYTTENEGKNWKSLVKETVDATLNRVSASGVQGASYFTGSVKSIDRDPSGGYVAVAQRGNFYLTFTPGDTRWIPHNRISARRIQAMGFRGAANGLQNDGAWMTLNGGYLTGTANSSFNEFEVDTKQLFTSSAIRTGGIGIIDVKFRTPTEGWAVGGSGVMYYSTDSGKSWNFDPSGKELPCNLYNIKFFEGGKVGYMIGSQGILLRKRFEA